jgi:hypothetical protein
LSAETEEWAKILENRANRLAHLAAAILFFVLLLAVSAFLVFIYAASITRSDLSASDIDAKLNASTATIEKLAKDQEEGSRVDAERAGQVAEKIKAVGEHLAATPSSKVSVLNPANVGGSLDLGTEPFTAVHLSQIVIANLPKSGPDGLITQSLNFRGYPAIALRGPIEDWTTFASDIKDFAPLLQALDAYSAEMKKEYDIQDARNLNDAAHRKLYDKKSDAIAGLLGTSQDNDRSSTIVSLIATNVTRFGTLAILTFLISLSMSLYRYNVRLYAFYMARADALRMKGGLGQVSLISLASSLTPGVDFGKTPQTPIEQILELVRVAASVKGVKDE